jgi:hypothetical protein
MKPCRPQGFRFDQRFVFGIGGLMGGLRVL